MLDELDPYFVIGAPPCTAFRAWNAHLNFKKMPKEKVDRMVKARRLNPEAVAEAKASAKAAGKAKSKRSKKAV